MFRNMFLLPKGDIKVAEGSSDEKPLVLEGIYAKDFACLLQALYPDTSLSVIALNVYMYSLMFALFVSVFVLNFV